MPLPLPSAPEHLPEQLQQLLNVTADIMGDASAEEALGILTVALFTVTKNDNARFQKTMDFLDAAWNRHKKERVG